MESIKPSASLFLDKRRSKKEEKFPVKLSVYFDAEKRRYKTGVDLSEEDWTKINSSNIRDDQLRIVKRRLFAFHEKGQKIIDLLESFSFPAFEELFFEEKKVRRTSFVRDLFEEYIILLEKNDQIGTAVSYKTTLNSFERFKRGLRIGDISYSTLEEYERFLLNKKTSPSTVGIYMRQLRCIVNRAISLGLMKQEKYPFKDYSIPCSRNVKKALQADQLKLLLKYQTDDQNNRKALDFWLFSYLCNGINMKDICLLRPSNLDKDFFHFFRAKTKNTKKKDLRPIKVPLSKESKLIIEKWKNADPRNPFLFPILQDGLSARQIMYKVQDFTFFVNKHMKMVAAELGIQEKVGTYVARHSHSTILKQKGVPIEFIKENLGHSSVLVTEHYLADFSDEVKIEFSKLLLDL